MAELQRLLQANGTFKSELMAAFLSAEQSNFREHASPTSHSNSNDVKNCNNISESGYSSLSSPTKSQSPIQVTPAAQQNNNNNNEVFYDVPSMGGADNIDTTTYGDIATRIKSEPLTPGCGNNNQHAMMDTVNQQQQQQAFIKMETTTSPAACNIMDDNTTNLDVLVLELQLPVPESRQLLIDTTTSVIINANLATSRYTYENLYDSELSVNSVRHQRILQEIEEELTLSSSEREKKTADDASSLWQTFIANMVPEITEVVKFCKKLPGFSEIEQEDQIKLLKQGTFEVMLTRYCILVDTKNHEMFDPDMKIKYKREVVRAMPLGHFFEEFFNIADQVNPLNLTNDEIGLFTAMLMMSPQRMGIKNQKAVENIQQLYQQALLLHMKKSHADYEDIFKRLLCCIPTLRAVNQKHASALNNLKMSMPTKDMFPPLHTELCE